MDGTPASEGFRMPAEWEPHAATWLAWPHRHADWPGKFTSIAWVYAEIIRHLSRGERVRLIVPAAVRERVRGVLERAGVDLGQVDFYPWPTDRSWVRDSGPIFVTAPGERGVLDWHFNAWAKYPNWQNDDQLPARAAEILGLRRWQPRYQGRRVVLEGGAIDVNGAGRMLTTEECLLSDVQARNPDVSRADLEDVFADYLGVTDVIWLGRGIVGDDTHGHVDDLARFVGPQRVVTVIENDATDENYAPLQENLERLLGAGLEVIALPMPEPVVFDGQRLPASYANFYIGNECVLVPTFNDAADRVALGQLAELFPDRRVVGIHAVDLVWGLGTLHCLSQQEPAVPVLG
jgi:agmatine deiminase